MVFLVQRSDVTKLALARDVELGRGAEAVAVVGRADVPEPSVARISARGSTVYVVGTTALHRFAWDGTLLARDADFAAAYRTLPGQTYGWDNTSTYVQNPPYFTGITTTPKPVTDIVGARILGLFGDKITTDHISPAGSIKAASPAGKYLLDNGVNPGSYTHLTLPPNYSV